jgi:hypothetical protein
MVPCQSSPGVVPLLPGLDPVAMTMPMVLSTREIDPFSWIHGVRTTTRPGRRRRWVSCRPRGRGQVGPWCCPSSPGCCVSSTPRKSSRWTQIIGEESDSQLGDFIEDFEAVSRWIWFPSPCYRTSCSRRWRRPSRRPAWSGSDCAHRRPTPPPMRSALPTGVTRERTRQIEIKTISKLHHPSRSGTLRDYLD